MPRCSGRNWRGISLAYWFSNSGFTSQVRSSFFRSSLFGSSPGSLHPFLCLHSPPAHPWRLVCGYHSCMSPAGTVSFVATFEEARHIVEQHATRVLASGTSATKVESADLLAARGRVLAEAILADRDFPPFARATRDGYAVRAEDVQAVPARLAVLGEIRAGDSRETCAIHRGQAFSIMTGAPLPAGADAMVMVEYTAVAEPQQSGDLTHPHAAKDAASGWGTLGDGTRLHEEFVEIRRSVKSGRKFCSARSGGSCGAVTGRQRPQVESCADWYGGGGGQEPV